MIAIPLADQDALAILLTDISKPKGMKDIPVKEMNGSVFAKLVRKPPGAPDSGGADARPGIAP